MRNDKATTGQYQVIIVLLFANLVLWYLIFNDFKLVLIKKDNPNVPVKGILDQ